MEPDPNWLYSTTAQSAAAIVAIIGGFLVSRVVALSAEKNGLLRRVDELRDSMAGVRGSIEEALGEVNTLSHRKGMIGNDFTRFDETLEVDRNLDVANDDLEEQQRHLQALRDEIRTVHLALARVGKPEGVTAGMFVLSGFAAVGIVWPLIALSMRPVPGVWWVRALTIAAFVAGLIAVIAYLRAALRSLDRGEVRPASSVAGVVAEMVKPAE